MKRITLFTLLYGLLISAPVMNAQAQDFCSAMDQVRLSMGDNFSSIKGTQSWDEKNNTAYWSSTVTLPGSTYSDIEGESGSLNSSAYYRFAKTASYDDAKAIYDRLKAKTQTCKPADWYDETDDDFSNNYIEYVLMDADYYAFDPGRYISVSLEKDKTDGLYYVEIIFGNSK